MELGKMVIDKDKLYRVHILFSSGKEVTTLVTNLHKSGGVWNFDSVASPYVLFTSDVNCFSILDEYENE